MPGRMRGISLYVFAGVLCAALFLGVQYSRYVRLYWAQLMPVSSITFETQPVTLVPHAHGGGDSPEDDGHHIDSRSPLFVAPRDLWVTGADFSVRNAPDATLHHADFLRYDQIEQPCGVDNPDGYAWPEEILSFSQDQLHTPHATLPAGYALFIPKGTPIQLLAEFHNPEPPLGPGGTYHGASVRVTFELASSSSGLVPVHFKSLYLEDHSCSATDPNQFSVPAHSDDFVMEPDVSLNSKSQRVLQADSTIVYMGAHIHGWQGGTSVVLKKNGVVVATFETALSTTTPYRYDTPHYPAYLPLKKGDVISIESHYTNLSGTNEHGAMASLGIFLTGPDDALEPVSAVTSPGSQ